MTTTTPLGQHRNRFLRLVLLLLQSATLGTSLHPSSPVSTLNDVESYQGLANEFTWHASFFGNISTSENQVSFVTSDELLQYASTSSSEAVEPAKHAIISRPWTVRGDVDEEDMSQRTSRAPIPGPDISDRPTVINLAKMASDAYVLTPTQPDWLNTTLKFNYSSSFGWSDKGLRGHVFADRWNKTVIVSFKGTTIDPREKWTENDRINDNILFSCCCGDQRPDPYPYAPVCDCRSDVYTCNATCITQELGQKDRYYSTALAVMYNVTATFPDSDFWVVGHSMGGSMASLMGLTFGFPVVTFEAPGEQLPAKRLGLTKKHGPGAYHFGNTADPVFMGACNGWTSSCGIAGYAFESQCFTGKRCVYDTVGDLGWHLNIANHRINTVITDVLEKYNDTAICEEDDECVDCFNWKSG